MAEGHGRRLPVHPGEILLEEFLLPMGLTQEELAAHIDVPLRTVREIVRGRRRLDAELAWLLAQAFDTTPDYWVNLQGAYDLAKHRPAKIVPRLRAPVQG